MNKILGYKNFIGVDSNCFLPNITFAAKELLKYYSIKAEILNFNSVAFPFDYIKYKNKIDVFSHFAVGTYYFYPIANMVLKKGGIYIAELEDPDPGIYKDILKF